MNNLTHLALVDSRKEQSQSHDGYWFNAEDSIWRLNKNISINVGLVRDLLDLELKSSFTATLTYYARNYSANHTQGMNSRLKFLLQSTGASAIDVKMLINFRATLTRETEYYLGSLRGFLYQWHDLGYSGIDDNVIELLKSWTLAGNIKGDAVKRKDPTKGPLTDNELIAFNEGVVRAFEKNRLSITELALALFISNTGRRPIQLTHLKICDLDDTKKNKKAEQMYLVHIPRAKQQGNRFRDDFKTFAVTFELWAILAAQRVACIASVEQVLGYELQDVDRRALPLFPDLAAFEGVKSIVELRDLLSTDRLCLKSEVVTDTLQKIVDTASIYSERTGELIEIVARRFRYTKGTRAAREGFGVLVIAELLDHADSQNAGVYTKNVPEHAHPLNKAMALHLAPYAQAFQGVVVDREGDAIRGSDPSSRIKYRGQNAATCGQHGYCGANAPIPCYTCSHFQPWLDGPHEEVLANLFSEREQVKQITGDEVMAAVNDRTILAVINVIQRCELRRQELEIMASRGR